MLGIPRLSLFRTFSGLLYVFTVLVTVVAAGLSCAAIISQAVRTSENRSWSKNFNALIVGASYIIVFVVSLLLCIKRRIAVRLKLHRISKVYRPVGDDLPKPVHKYVAQEYIRACLVSYESLPKDIVHEGWGRPGTEYQGLYFRRALLDTIQRIDHLAHTLMPTHPPLKPHARMLLHFRFLIPLLPVDEDGLTPLHYYDSAIQVARNAEREVSEEEYEVGVRFGKEIEQTLEDCVAEMLAERDSQSDSISQPRVSGEG